MLILIGALTAGALVWVIYDNWRHTKEEYDAFHKFNNGEELPEPPPPVNEIDSARLVLLMKRGKA